MKDREFKVKSLKTNEVLTIRGKTLAKALETEGLSPLVWKPVEEPESPPEEEFGKAEETPGS